MDPRALLAELRKEASGEVRADLSPRSIVTLSSYNLLRFPSLV